MHILCVRRVRVASPLRLARRDSLASWQAASATGRLALPLSDTSGSLTPSWRVQLGLIGASLAGSDAYAAGQWPIVRLANSRLAVRQLEPLRQPAVASRGSSCLGASGTGISGSPRQRHHHDWTWPPQAAARDTNRYHSSSRQRQLFAISQQMCRRLLLSEIASSAPQAICRRVHHALSQFGDLVAVMKAGTAGHGDAATTAGRWECGAGLQAEEKLTKLAHTDAGQKSEIASRRRAASSTAMRLEQDSRNPLDATYLARPEGGRRRAELPVVPCFAAACAFSSRSSCVVKD